jgi:plasmid stabilization system protein ParE
MPRAERDLEAIYLYIRAENSIPANRWFQRLVQAIEGLAELPHHHPLTPEDRTLHHLLFGNKPHIYRVIFSIDDTSQRVEVLHVRHGARQKFVADEIV